MPLPLLYHDITNIIIDHLHDDVPSLCSCSLACKQLVPSSRFHLFSDVEIIPETVTRFLELLDTAETTIAPSIRRLAVSRFRFRSRRFNVDVLPYAVESLQKVSLLLPNVRSLELFQASKLCAPQLATHVTNLVLEAILCHDTNELLDYLYSFPHLRTLSIARVAFQTDCVPKEYPPTIGGPSFSFQTLDLRALYPESLNIFKWLMTLSPRTPVHVVKCDVYSDNEGPILGPIGPSVERLEITYDDGPGTRFSLSRLCLIAQPRWCSSRPRRIGRYYHMCECPSTCISYPVCRTKLRSFEPLLDCETSLYHSFHSGRRASPPIQRPADDALIFLGTYLKHLGRAQIFGSKANGIQKLEVV